MGLALIKDMTLDGKPILPTGGTGSFGNKPTEIILKQRSSRKFTPCPSTMTGFFRGREDDFSGREDDVLDLMLKAMRPGDLGGTAC